MTTQIVKIRYGSKNFRQAVALFTFMTSITCQLIIVAMKKLEYDINWIVSGLKSWVKRHPQHKACQQCATHHQHGQGEKSNLCATKILYWLKIWCDSCTLSVATTKNTAMTKDVKSVNLCQTYIACNVWQDVEKEVCGPRLIGNGENVKHGLQWKGCQIVMTWTIMQMLQYLSWATIGTRSSNGTPIRICSTWRVFWFFLFRRWGFRLTLLLLLPLPMHDHCCLHVVTRNYSLHGLVDLAL